MKFFLDIYRNILFCVHGGIMSRETGYVKHIITSLVMIVLMSVLLSCTSDLFTKSNNEGNSDGKLYAWIEHSDEKDILRHLVKKYSKYNLRITESYKVPIYLFMYQYIANITFNDNSISEEALMKLLNKDQNIRGVSLTPEWTEGDITLSLSNGNSESEVEEILHSYAKYEIELKYRDRVSDRIRVSFNYELVNYLVILNILEKDNRIYHASINRHVPEWELGVLLVFLSDIEYLEEFVSDYQEQIQEYSYHPSPGQVFMTITFDYIEIDEYEFLEIIQYDHRVDGAGFNYFHYI